MRARTAGDHTFVARACGIPALDGRSMDSRLLVEIDRVLGAGSAGSRAFLRTADGGLGFQSVERTGPAAYAASWHSCLPSILARLKAQMQHREKEF